MKNFLNSIWLSIIFTIAMINSCSAYPPDVIKSVSIKINSGAAAVHLVPFIQTLAVGDTMIIQAIVSPPYMFNGWSGGISGMENPKKIIVDRPLSITINYTTALSYRVSLENSEYISSNEFDFDVMIRSFNEAFELTAYQIVLDFNEAWKNGGSLLMNLIPGSSDLMNIPAAAFNIFDHKLTFATAGSGRDTITILEKRIGRFKVKNLIGYAFGIPVDLKFYFQSPIETIITGENVTDLTQYGSFINLPEKHQIKISFE